MSEIRPATDLVLLHLADCVKKVAEHEHPERGADFFCLNLVAYMGERMAFVLERVKVEQAEARKLQDRCNALADEATGYLDRIAEMEADA